jgi:hypothetical protein
LTEKKAEEKTAKEQGTSQKSLIEGLRSTTELGRKSYERRFSNDRIVLSGVLSFLRDIAVHPVWQELFFGKAHK